MRWCVWCLLDLRATGQESPQRLVASVGASAALATGDYSRLDSCLILPVLLFPTLKIVLILKRVVMLGEVLVDTLWMTKKQYVSTIDY